MDCAFLIYPVYPSKNEAIAGAVRLEVAGRSESRL